MKDKRLTPGQAFEALLNDKIIVALVAAGPVLLRRGPGLGVEYTWDSFEPKRWYPKIDPFTWLNWEAAIYLLSDWEAMQKEKEQAKQDESFNCTCGAAHLKQKNPDKTIFHLYPCKCLETCAGKEEPELPEEIASCFKSFPWMWSCDKEWFKNYTKLILKYARVR